MYHEFVRIGFLPILIHRCVGFCKLEVDVAGKRKSGKPLYCLLSGLYWTVKNIKMAERVGFRFNHPNSLNFIPAWLCSLHRPYP